MQPVKEIIYKVADTLTLGRGVKREFSGFNVRLPLRYRGYFPLDYEKDNFAFLRKNCGPGAVVIDVGAHIGLFAVCAAQQCGDSGKVYAFEPTPQTFSLLKKTIALNKKDHIIQGVDQAVAEKNGVTYFNVSSLEGDNSNSLVTYRKDKDLHQVEVKITSIDDFISVNGINKIDFIKIDAEGYEYNVLRGAAETFSRSRPRGILALHPAGIAANGDSLDKIYSFLAEKNYDVRYEDASMSREAFCSQNNLFDVHLIPR